LGPILHDVALMQPHGLSVLLFGVVGKWQEWVRWPFDEVEGRCCGGDGQVGAAMLGLLIKINISCADQLPTNILKLAICAQTIPKGI